MWDWWIVWYFYLGGIAAGTYCLSLLIDMVGEARDRVLARVGYFLAAPLTVACGILLILDLEQPTRFWHMLFDASAGWPHVQFWSPMSLGAWVLLAFGAVTTVSFIGVLVETGLIGDVAWRERARSLRAGIAGRIFDCTGLACALFIASYTGVLLTATNQPVWSDTQWVGAVFLASAVSSGASIIAYVACRRRLHESLPALERVENALALLEILAIVALCVSLGESARVLLTSSAATIFFFTVPFGVVLPGLIRWVGGHRTGAAALSCVLVLSGNFVLRVSVLESRDLNDPTRATVAVGSFAPPNDAPSSANPIATSADTLSAACRCICDRLVLMERVAYAKWTHGLPIEDVAREAKIVESQRLAAIGRGLDANAIESLARAQIAAAKQVQAAWFAEWRVHGAPQRVAADLQNELRPKLDDLDAQLLAAVQACRGLPESVVRSHVAAECTARLRSQLAGDLCERLSQALADAIVHHK